MASAWTTDSLLKLSGWVGRVESALAGGEDKEWVWAMRWCAWSLLLECRGSPGLDVRGYAPGLWRMGETGRRLLRAVVRMLCRKELLTLEGNRAFVREGEETEPAIERLWEWLEQHPPVGQG
jgi:hypothetical protein